MNKEKALINFSSRPKSYLPKYASRRFGGEAMHFRSSCYKEEGESELLERIKTRVKEELTSQLATRATKDELNTIIAQLDFLKKKDDGTGGFPIEALRAMADDKNGAMAVLAKQGLELQQLKNDMGEKPKDLSIRGQIKAWLNSPNEDGGAVTVKDTVKQIRSGKKADLKPLELELQVRAANSPMLPSNTYGGSAYLPKPEIAPGIVDVVRPQPTFWNYIKKGSTSSAVYVWVNKKVPAGMGAAAFIAPGVYKPGISFTIDTQISNAKKIAANEKVAVELLDDIDGLASWVEDELMYQIDQKASLTLMSSAGDANTPEGIQNLSVPYAGAGLGIHTENANNWDAIRAAVGQLQAANFIGYPVTAFLNPIDYANMVMTKAQNQGQLFIPPVTGATIVVDNNIPVGYVQIACLDLYKILIYKGFTMTWGLENDDFTKNLRTVIGEMRIHQFFSENHAGSLIYDTFANIIAALS